MARYPNEIECDLAQYYQVHDWHEYPAAHIATLACGLPRDSRVVKAINGIKYDTEELLMASAVDRLSLLWWSKTKDGQNNINRPKMFINTLLEKEEKTDIIQSFKTGEDFEKARNEIIKRKLLNG